ncbi:DUF418 domain-containing protein [Bacteroides sp. OttesenSCG-928-M17]|nr:DUF418 domain-containing protein [Bacteroides sp. OttesenSCG-928-M17]
MVQKIAEQQARIDVADVLRGFAVLGIIILHSIEHFNFYSFPKEVPFEWMKFTDKAIWDGLFFAFSGKAYAIFSLLFGFSFFIQYNSQQERGKDFRLRFLWRMVLLFLIGQFNAAFFTGEILTMYAMIGIILPLCCKLSNRAIAIIATILILQPYDWGRMIYALLNPEYEVGKSLAGHYFSLAFEVQKSGTFWETVRMNMWEGQMANMTWALEHGRIPQTAALFLFGMLAGRKRFFLYSKENEQIWLKTLGISLLCFFPIYGLHNMLPEFISNKAVLQPLTLILYSFKNLAFMAAIVCGILLTFYRCKDRSLLMRLAPYGKMSLTHYIGQSIVGSLFFYHWGFELGRYLGITYSLLFGIVFVIFQMTFSTLWFKRHRHGPFEKLWRKLTWIGTKH